MYCILFTTEIKLFVVLSRGVSPMACRSGLEKVGEKKLVIFQHVANQFQAV